MFRVLLFIAVLGFAAADFHQAAAQQRGGRPGQFDFYVLALSWSPSYCAAAGSRANRRQCFSGRPFAFVVHGLWPQFERGWPQYCRTRGRRRLRRNEIDSILDLMPSRGLIRHEWKKHGTCSGLSPGGYLREVRRAWNRIEIPERYRRIDRHLMVDPRDVEADFLAANPDLPANAIAVTCDRRRLREVRICMDKDLRFRRCLSVDRRGCRSNRVVLPPVRGG